ncbi:CNT_collapsed_G0012490.mRNA.1.CDS.1 [Saccharomyces cerevisiae]|nr:CNT_collapsed_G0012490.mRNA.1.CDS.1 [Saccharomyces cerevisiae]
MQDAFEVGDRVIQDLVVSGALSLENSIDLSNIKHTTWKDWERINKKELLRGKKEHKTRSKFLTFEELWNGVEGI